MANGQVITKNGKNLFLSRIVGATQTALSQFRIGTGTTTPVEANTGLETPLSAWSGGLDYKALLSTVLDTTNKKVIMTGYVDSTEGNGSTLTESGVFNTDGTPVCYSHDVFTALAKDATIEVFIEWTDEAT